MERRVKLTVSPLYPYATVYGIFQTNLPPPNDGFPRRTYSTSITFYLDTLATRTTLSPGTARQIGIPLHELPCATTHTFLGPLDVRVLEDARLSVRPVEGAQIPLSLGQVHIMDSALMDQGLSQEDIDRIPDIMGTDILMRGTVQIDWTGGSGHLALKLRKEGNVHYITDPTAR